jgi:hypothetical protein
MGTARMYGRAVARLALAGMLARIRSTRFGPVCVLVGAILLVGCGGGHATSSTGRSSTASVAQVTMAPGRLSGARARKVSLVCRRAETVEDQNVIQQFADKGVTIYTPNVVGALKRASRDVSHEAASARLLDPALSRDMTAEAVVLAKAGRLARPSYEAALLTILHRRFSVAREAGVPACAGAQAGALPATAPTA